MLAYSFAGFYTVASLVLRAQDSTYVLVVHVNMSFVYYVVMGPTGPMLCSSQSSGSPFWNKLTFQVTWLQMRRHPLHLYVGVVASFLTCTYQIITRCWTLIFQILTCVHLSGSHHFCMSRLSKNSYLNDSAHKLLMIPHTNFEMFDDSTHEYCIHPRRLSVLTEYLSLSLTHFTPINIANHFI